MPKKKKSPRKSPRKEYISDRMPTSSRLYLKNTDLPKLNKLNNFFEKIRINKQKIVSIDLSNKHLDNTNTFNKWTLQSLLYTPIFKDSLKILNLSKTNILEIDLTYLNKLEVLDLSNNPIYNLYIPGYIKLKKLNLSNTKLSRLDFFGNQDSVQELFLQNTRIIDISLNNLSNLRILDCSNTEITDINCRNCLNIEKIDISNNSNLKQVYISDCEKLKYLDCKFCIIDNLNLINIPSLLTLTCQKNKLKKLVTSEFKKLQMLNCSNNNFNLIDSLILPYKSALKKLICSNCNISNLYFGFQISLKELNCSDNKLSKLELNENTPLEKLDCSSNNIQTLDISNLQI